jgi:hypothetical protein
LEPQAPLAAIACYRGKRLQLMRGVGVLVVQSRGAEASGAVLIDRVPLRGSVVLRVRFLGERFVAKCQVRGGNADTSQLILEEQLRPSNERAFPRVSVRAQGVLYLKPPALGVPIEILDLSVAGVALRPAEATMPGVGDRRMVAIDLRGRVIKSVIEFVGCDHERWRGRFLHLGLSDEAAIASYVLSEQIRERGSLTTTEAQLSSSLDPGERVRFPLLEGLHIQGEMVMLRSRNDEERVPCPPLAEGLRRKLEALAGRVRLSEAADMYWLLEGMGVPEPAADSVLLAYWVLTARVTSRDIVEASGFAWPHSSKESLSSDDPRSSLSASPERRESSVAKQEQSREDVATDSLSAADLGRGRRELARCCGLGVFGAARPLLGRIDPLQLLCLLGEGGREIQPLPGPLRDTSALARVAHELRSWARA